MDISPSVYEHAAFLIGRTPWEASRDGDLIFEGHAKAFMRKVWVEPARCLTRRRPKTS